MFYVVGVASSDKVWCAFVFSCLSERLSSPLFRRDSPPFSEVGNSRLHSILFNYSTFYGTGQIIYAICDFGGSIRYHIFFYTLPPF